MFYKLDNLKNIMAYIEHRPTTTANVKAQRENEGLNYGGNAVPKFKVK